MDRLVDLVNHPLVAFSVSTAVFVVAGCHRKRTLVLIKNNSSAAKAIPVTVSDNSNRMNLKGLPTDILEPQMEAQGEGALPPRTVISMFRESVEKNGDKVALALKRKGTNGVIPTMWKYWTYTEYWSDCIAFGKALLALNVEKYSVINILGFNSPEWLIANNGSIMAGCIAAGIYITNSPAACSYISTHSKANILFCDGNDQLRKYKEFVSSTEKKAEHVPELKAIVVWGGAELDTEFVSASVVPVYSWAEFLSKGDTVSDSALDARMGRSSAGECAALIYTSGTTGPPKAVMLSHDNITWMCRNFATNHVCNGTAPGGRVVSYLPLSHVAAQMIDIHYVYFAAGCTYFAQPDALRGSLAQTLVDVRPTVFFGVPRVWEKMEEKLKEIGRQSTGLKKGIADWAKALGSLNQAGAQFGAVGTKPWGYHLARVVVLKKIREALGLDKCSAFFTAAAPISVETLEYFSSLDIPVHELFGCSESTGPHTSSKVDAWRIGYCGRPLPGVHTHISTDGSEELLLKGRHIFMGYMYMQDQTAAAFTESGFYRTGDIATFDASDAYPVGEETALSGPQGFMRITGRIKDLIISAGGENIPPVLIEEELKVAVPCVSNALVVGDRRKYLTVLLTVKTVSPDSENLTPLVLAVAAEIGSNATTAAMVATDPKWAQYFNQQLVIMNGKATSNAHKIQKHRILETDFSEIGGDLTPTLKVKRKVVCEKHAKIIDEMYAE